MSGQVADELPQPGDAHDEEQLEDDDEVPLGLGLDDPAEFLQCWTR